MKEPGIVNACLWFVLGIAFCLIVVPRHQPELRSETQEQIMEVPGVERIPEESSLMIYFEDRAFKSEAMFEPGNLYYNKPQFEKLNDVQAEFITMILNIDGVTRVWTHEYKMKIFKADDFSWEQINAQLQEIIFQKALELLETPVDFPRQTTEDPKGPLFILTVLSYN